MEQKNYIEAKLAELDKALSQKKRIKALFPNQRARDKAMAYIDVETQDEVCLTMKTGEDITRGLPGTFALTLGVLFSLIAYHSNTGNTVEYLVFLWHFYCFFLCSSVMGSIFAHALSGYIQSAYPRGICPFQW